MQFASAVVIELVLWMAVDLLSQTALDCRLGSSHGRNTESGGGPRAGRDGEFAGWCWLIVFIDHFVGIVGSRVCGWTSVYLGGPLVRLQRGSFLLILFNRRRQPKNGCEMRETAEKLSETGDCAAAGSIWVQGQNPGRGLALSEEIDLGAWDGQFAAGWQGVPRTRLGSAGPGFKKATVWPLVFASWWRSLPLPAQHRTLCETTWRLHSVHDTTTTRATLIPRCFGRNWKWYTTTFEVTIHGPVCGAATSDLSRPMPSSGPRSAI